LAWFSSSPSHLAVVGERYHAFLSQATRFVGIQPCAVIIGNNTYADGETTLFVGAHYEVTNGNATKYYFAGSQRTPALAAGASVALRTPDGALKYMLGDHLGSTSLVTDSNGALITETKYKACPLRYRYGVLREGEVRYTTPNTTLSTRYTFTGQYSYVSDDATDLGNNGFGLMFYNARWYDPALGRFAQADSIVAGDYHTGAMFTALTVGYFELPIIAKVNADDRFIQQHGGSLMNVKEKDKRDAKIAGVPLITQALDRYAYTLNNPVKYSDPTGHWTITWEQWIGKIKGLFEALIGPESEWAYNVAFGHNVGAAIGAFIFGVGFGVSCLPSIVGSLVCGGVGILIGGAVGYGAGGYLAGDTAFYQLSDIYNAITEAFAKAATIFGDDVIPGYVVIESSQSGDQYIITVYGYDYNGTEKFKRTITIGGEAFADLIGILVQPNSAP
jgi:hypothetical protein